MRTVQCSFSRVQFRRAPLPLNFLPPTSTESYHGRLSASKSRLRLSYLLNNYGVYALHLCFMGGRVTPSRYINVSGKWTSAGDAVGLLLALLRGQRMIRQPLPTKITILSYSESGKTTSLVFPTWWRKGMTGKCIFLTMSVISLTINFSQLC